MRGATRYLVARHREKIERVPQALLKHKTLCADQIDHALQCGANEIDMIIINRGALHGRSARAA
jgi:deoxyribose-phosphate aldolase